MKFLSRDFDLESISAFLRALSSIYEQAARSAASSKGI
jgi:predicted MarR family transcription regulator